jgi:intron-binding protein aquarius
VSNIQLDQQGRSRVEIASLYSWKYTSENGEKSLKNLPNVENNDFFLKANAGFAHTFQFIDVQYFQGKGEFAPTPYFYQNLGEAEYVVAVFQYMRLIGYPASKISIITTYNGQKNLIQDIIQQRCKNSFFGFPAAISTVDKFQGQQNDIILLSLVRTESIGHIRDIRRLIVALSRARLGLYIFGYQELFENCFELKKVFSSLLTSKSNKLELIAGEAYPTERKVSDEVNGNFVYTINDVTAMGVLVYQMVQQKQNNVVVDTE